MKRLGLLVVLIAVVVVQSGCTTSRRAARTREQVNQALSKRERVTRQPVEVTLAITGLAHLLDSTNTQPVVVFPRVAQHSTMVLAEARFDPQGLPEKTKQLLSGLTFRWRTVDRAMTLDPASFGITSPRLVVVQEQNPLAECPGEGTNPERSDSLHWILNTERVAGRTDLQIRSEISAPNPDPQHVSLRLPIGNGRLSAELPLGARRVKFVDATGVERRQAVAEYLNYTFTTQLERGMPYSLVAKDLETGQPLVLGLFMPHQGKIRIVLANAIPTGFFAPHSVDSIGHFSHYFTSAYTTPPPVPTQEADSPSTCGGPISATVECGPGRPKP